MHGPLPSKSCKAHITGATTSRKFVHHSQKYSFNTYSFTFFDMVRALTVRLSWNLDTYPIHCGSTTLCSNAVLTCNNWSTIMKFNPNLVFPDINKLNVSSCLRKMASGMCYLFMNLTIVLDFFTTSFIHVAFLQSSNNRFIA
jgi:hypothetical protein